ncbi:MAG: hypothetical protein O3A46_02690, partial [Candidatus Poribacteria bacterium]|nr:hypothetical protein [Candidatus Poribacteria bacterium]
DGIPERWSLENAMQTPENVGTAWAQWDRDALYLFIQVNRESITIGDPTRWYELSDAVELHIATNPDGDPRPPHLATDGNASNFVFWILPKGGGVSGDRAYVGRAKPTIQYNVRQIEVAAREGESAYFLELRIPFLTALNGFDPIASERRNRIGFNFLIYRADAPQVWWTEPTSLTAPPSMAGLLYLNRPPTDW